MNRNQNDSGSGVLNRRSFTIAAGAAALAVVVPRVESQSVNTECKDASREPLTGNGEWTYCVVSGWGKPPANVTFGGTHGAIARDQAGRIYVSTQSSTGVIVYTSEGAFVKTIASEFPEIHSMVHAIESREEYFYTTVQKGTPETNWLFVKMK